MYAIMFEFDMDTLKSTSLDLSAASVEIRKFMNNNHFAWQQGNLYFGDESINAVHCVLTIQKLAKSYLWFNSCVKNARMLRIDEINDLMPAVDL